MTNVDIYNDIYKEISEMIGIENTLKIYNHFKGQQVSFPVRLCNSKLARERIVNEFTGTNIKELVQRYNYSERTIRRMLKECDKQ